MANIARNVDLGGLLLSKQEELFKVLPKFIDKDRYLRIILSEIRLNSRLQQCSPLSFLGALTKASAWGLEPGLAGECHLIPRGRECSFEIGYLGYLKLLRRYTNLRQPNVDIIREGDKVSHLKGENPNTGEVQHFTHTYEIGKRGGIIGVYCQTQNKDDGHIDYLILDVQKVKEHEEKFAKNNSKLWSNHWESMAKKTVIKAFCKYAELSPKLTEASTSGDEKYWTAEGEERYYDAGNFSERPKEKEVKEEKIIQLNPNLQVQSKKVDPPPTLPQGVASANDDF